MSEYEELELKLGKSSKKCQEIVSNSSGLNRMLFVFFDKTGFKLKGSQRPILCIDNNLVENPLKDDCEADEENGNNLCKQPFFISFNGSALVAQDGTVFTLKQRLFLAFFNHYVPAIQYLYLIIKTN